MILGIEIALIVLGIYGLIKGRIPISKTRVVEGTPARLLALLGFVPLPLAFLLVALVLGTKIARGGQVNEDSARTTGIIIEVAVVIGTLLVFYVLGFVLATDPTRKVSEDWEDRPRRSRRARDDEEEEDEDRPRRRRRDDDEDDDIDRDDRRIKRRD
jgi:hypothetical protein